MITFVQSISLTRGVPVVEVWYGDRFIATICPPPLDNDRAAVTIISKHLDTVIRDDNAPAAVLVTFSP